MTKDGYRKITIDLELDNKAVRKLVRYASIQGWKANSKIPEKNRSQEAIKAALNHFISTICEWDI